jgi:menaquinone-9 beta-reductase
MPRELTIVGGGLAGLTLGIALRDAGLPVTIVEAGHYPRHRVCGEFISGRGQAVLSQLGLEARLTEAGMIHATHAQFFAGPRQSPMLGLPRPAWLISRHTLDALLADAFRERRGTLQTNTRWTAGYASAGVVRATGRKPGPVVKGDRWLGLKAHAVKVSLPVDLELHFTPAGYVGLSRLPGGSVNVCGLFRIRSSRPEDIFELLRGEEGSALRRRLSGAAWVDGSRCSTGGLFFGTVKDSVPECVVGDAFAMIPPLTGNGMSMAIESAALAVESLIDYALGRLEWDEARRNIRARCAERFRSRLFWGRWLQMGLVQSWLAPILVMALHRGGSLWPTAFHRTR